MTGFDDKVERQGEPAMGKTEVAPGKVRSILRPVQFLLDLAVLVFAFLLAYVLRFDFVLNPATAHRLMIQLPFVVLIQFVALHAVGAHAFVWRYVGLREATVFGKASVTATVPLLVLRFALPGSLQEWRVPLSIVVVDAILAFGGVLALRVTRRGLFERYERALSGGKRDKRSKAESVLLVGAGRAGVLAAREISTRGSISLGVRGFVDDDLSKHGSVISGIKVLGTTDDLPKLVGALGIDQVVITIARASRLELRRIVEICEQIPVKARIIPGLYEILDGSVEVSRIRDIEIEDLLGRDAIHLDEGSISAFLADKTVLVTGAGGSIGSELARQVVRFGVSTLLEVERAEFALFEVDRELRRLFPDSTIVPLVADIRDSQRMLSIFEAYRPSVVLHAAAHKHVPLMESNPTEAVNNNVLGTRLLGELAGRHDVEVFINISTDKAVRPTSVMGASKRAAELVVQDLNSTFNTRFVSVRFGNVMGSAGSVMPIFKEQIRKGGPVTVTHPDMVRYFMTIPEAAQLVLQAGAIGEGGEIFVLDMGDPVRIQDLAKDMISLYGLKPFVDIDIVFSGVRPGEKLFEELQAEGEGITKTRHPKIFIGMLKGYPRERIEEALTSFGELGQSGDASEIRQLFNELLPEARLMV